ncbi:unnamed protein product, partial [Mesorhabditis spiculigera]
MPSATSSCAPTAGAPLTADASPAGFKTGKISDIESRKPECQLPAVAANPITLSPTPRKFVDSWCVINAD